MKGKSQTQLVGVKEIARRAKVSIATVDRVLNNRIGVSEKTKQRILEIIKELNYQPNIMARRLASKKLIKFAVFIPEVSDETGYWNAPLEGIRKAAAEIKDYGIVVDIYFFDQNDRKTFLAQSSSILENEYNGVLLAPMFEAESLEFLERCRKKGIIYVFINSDIEDQHNLCYIGPNLYQSGYLVAHLIRYLVRGNEKILVVNISKEIDTHHHLLKKEDGFKAYFAKYYQDNELLRMDVRQTDYSSIKRSLEELFAAHSIDIIFVTNSRVSSVAQYLEDTGREDVKLIGFDFLDENIRFLKNGTIDFLICQKPREQGYRGVMALYHYLVQSQEIEKLHYMPIDIITRENYIFYEN
ncbi:LacI family DNA-binding transcriptional regulator [Olivibacter sitiensis]|uniref:LacI family DNA-binding transcriptional regulator n=1 Tax=Olivibacter sitiensis TaxID=376470 RepID=UPI0003F6D54E|nr:LacI family DNA-binding transcriptional regulator [Olivibacter sitiensis]